MTLKDIIQQWTPKSLRRLALAGALVAAGSAGAQTTLSVVPGQQYSGSQDFSGISITQSPDRIVAGKGSDPCTVYFFDTSFNLSGSYLINDHPGDPVLDQASTGVDDVIYHLIEDSGIEKVFSTTTGSSVSHEVGTGNPFNNYDHLAAVQIDSGDDAGDYLILVDKDAPDYRIWKVGSGWIGDSIELPTTDLDPPFGFIFVGDSSGAGAYLASDGENESSNIQDIILGIKIGIGIEFFKEGQHLDQRLVFMTGMGGAQGDIAFVPDYSNNTTEVYASTSTGVVARLAIDIGEGEYENLPIYVNPVATITGDTEGSESTANPTITVELSRHENDPYYPDVIPVPEVPITVEYTTGGLSLPPSFDRIWRN